MQGGRIAVVAGMALVLASCGGGSDTDEAQPPAPPATTTELVLPMPKIEEPPPKASRLVGTWARIGVRLLFRFGADGTFAFDRANLDLPHGAGMYELDGKTIRFTNHGPGCIDDWTWKVGIIEKEDPLDDELHVVFVESACDVPAGVEWMLARIGD